MASYELVRYDGSEVYESDIRPDNLHNLYWRTRDGELIAVPKLHDSHLRNIALMLMGFGYSEFKSQTLRSFRSVALRTMRQT